MSGIKVTVSEYVTNAFHVLFIQLCYTDVNLINILGYLGAKDPWQGEISNIRG